MGKILKIVWICKISNPTITSHLKYNWWHIRNIKRRLLRKPIDVEMDYGQWNTNAISQFENFDDIELTVICPFSRISGIQKFSVNGIDYVCFHSEDDTFISYVKRFLHLEGERHYLKNRGIISSVIHKISPDIIHLMGAENPSYSISALDFDSSVPSIVSLQTLMSDPNFWGNYPISKESYDYRSKIEREVINKCDYIASNLPAFNQIIVRDIKPNAKFLDMPLVLGVDVDLSETPKEYDFVYFAASIDKAGDDAIEAFALACKKYPSLTLNMSGSYSDSYKKGLVSRIAELGISKNVFITGAKASHKDVLHQIKKSKYALIPLKVDLISGTIREAMACGLPVVTTITPATPELNKDRKSVLLSEKGDYKAMADNMIALVENNDLYELLKANGAITVSEKYSNRIIADKWKKAYYNIVNTRV